MYGAMKKLIAKHFYASREDTQNKLDVFFAVNRLNDEEYAELTLLAEEAYRE